MKMKMKKFWHWKNRLHHLWYRYMYGVELGLDGTIPAVYGRGKYVDVLKNGPYIEITSHSSNKLEPPGMIRLIPCQYNHGLMVEWHDQNGNMHWRTHLDYSALYQHGAGTQKQELNVPVHLDRRFSSGAVKFI